MAGSLTYRVFLVLDHASGLISSSRSHHRGDHGGAKRGVREKAPPGPSPTRSRAGRAAR
jgi:hypothetical protein